MPNRWNPGCNCCGCYRCDGSEVKGVSIVIAGLPAQAVMRYSFGNTLYEETWDDFDQANGTWLFPTKADPAQPSAPACFVDESQTIGSATVTRQVIQDGFGGPYPAVATTATLIIKPRGILRATLAPGSGVVDLPTPPTNDFLADLITAAEDLGGTPHCIDMGSDTASGSSSSCALKRKIVSSVTSGWFCEQSPTNLIGASIQCDYTF